MTRMHDDYQNQLSELLSDVRIPIENLAFALDQYILQRGRQLDPETRVLLCGVRNSLDQVAQSTRRITDKSVQCLEVQPEVAQTGHALAV